MVSNWQDPWQTDPDRSRAPPFEQPSQEEQRANSARWTKRFSSNWHDWHQLRLNAPGAPRTPNADVAVKAALGSDATAMKCL
jgi:hypothetical protein